MSRTQWSNPYMDDGARMILSICRCVPSIMVLTHIGIKMYHKISEAYHKVSAANIYRYMDDGSKMILSICKYVPSIMALAHIETEKYHKISKALSFSQ